MSREALYKFVLPKYKLVQTEALYAFYWRPKFGPGSTSPCFEDESANNSILDAICGTFNMFKKS